MDIKPQLQPVKNFQSSDLAKQVSLFRLARSIIWLHAVHAKIHLSAPWSDKKRKVGGLFLFLFLDWGSCVPVRFRKWIGFHVQSVTGFGWLSRGWGEGAHSLDFKAVRNRRTTSLFGFQGSEDQILIDDIDECSGRFDCCAETGSIVVTRVRIWRAKCPVILLVKYGQIFLCYRLLKWVAKWKGRVFDVP